MSRYVSKNDVSRKTKRLTIFLTGRGKVRKMSEVTVPLNLSLIDGKKIECWNALKYLSVAYTELYGTQNFDGNSFHARLKPYFGL